MHGPAPKWTGPVFGSVSQWDDRSEERAVRRWLVCAPGLYKFMRRMLRSGHDRWLSGRANGFVIELAELLCRRSWVAQEVAAQLRLSSYTRIYDTLHLAL